LDKEKISYQLRIGDVVGDVMEQAIKKGLSFIGDEIYSQGMAMSNIDTNLFEYNRIFSKAWPADAAVSAIGAVAKANQIDHIRLFVLEAFDQVLESGEIGIGTGSSDSSSDEDQASASEDNQLKTSADGNRRKLSRKMKRKQLEEASGGNGDILEVRSLN
jgi:hypothetical protein